MTYRIALNTNTLGTEEIEAAVALLRSDRLTMGPLVEAFERQFAAELGVRHRGRYTGTFGDMGR